MLAVGALEIMEKRDGGRDGGRGLRLVKTGEDGPKSC